MFNGKCHYKSPFSIAMLNYQWVNLSFSLSRDPKPEAALLHLSDLQRLDERWMVAIHPAPEIQTLKGTI